MTCIVGYKDPKGKIWIGSDSCGSNGTTHVQRKDPKVLRNGPLTIGFTSSFRMGQILQHHLIAPPIKTKDIYKYLVVDLIPEAREVLEENGYGSSDEEGDIGGVWIVAAGDTVAKIGSDFQVGIPIGGLACVGSGEEIAMGSMLARIEAGIQSPKEMINSAIADAASYVCGIAEPIKVLKHKG